MIRAIFQTGFRVLFFASCLFAVTTSSQADQASDQLNSLFDQLKLATTAEEARMIEQRIWDAWNKNDDPDAEARLLRSKESWATGRVVEAIAQLNDMVERYPEWVTPWNLRATYQYLLGNFDTSLADVDRVLALEPRHFGALTGAGGILVQQGKLEEALAYYLRALEVYPTMLPIQARVKELERILGPSV